MLTAYIEKHVASSHPTSVIIVVLAVAVIITVTLVVPQVVLVVVVLVVVKVIVLAAFQSHSSTRHIKPHLLSIMMQYLGRD